MNIVATTTTSFGQIIDWTMPTKEDLLAEAELRKAPPPPPLDPLPEGFVYAKSPLETEPDARGPAGTVPHVRPDIDELLKAWGDKVPARPEQIYDIIPPPAIINCGHGQAGPCYYHSTKGVFSSPVGTAFKSLGGRVSLWKVGDRANNDHSIMQTWLVSSKDTIESGKREASAQHSGNPYFFVFFTNNLYDQAKTPGYCDPAGITSTLSGGYVPGTNSEAYGYTITPGTPWPPEVVFQDLHSNPGQVLDIKWEQGSTAGKWYLYVNGLSVGQFNPTCTGGKTMWHPTDGTANDGLRTGAHKAEWGGEVFNAGQFGPTTPTDMGNALYPTETGAAWIDRMSLKLAAGGSWVGYNSLPGGYTKFSTVQDSACYGQGATTPTNGFYLGGDGSDELGCPSP